MYFLSLIFLTLSTLLSLSTCQNQNPPLLRIYSTDGYFETKVGMSDITNVTSPSALLAILPQAIKFCTTGLWKFYPDTNYRDTPTNAGIILGSQSQSSLLTVCKDIPESSISMFLSMKSFRSLGPKDNMDKTSITFYSEKYYSGFEQTFDFEYFGNDSQYGASYLPIVQSYVITSQNSQNSHPDSTSTVSTVIHYFKIFWKYNYEGNNACLVLNPHTKLYARGTLDKIGSELATIVFSSMKYYRSLSNVSEHCGSALTDFYLGLFHLPPSTQI